MADAVDDKQQLTPETESSDASRQKKAPKSPVEKMRIRLAAEGYDSQYDPMKNEDEQSSLADDSCNTYYFSISTTVLSSDI